MWLQEALTVWCFKSYKSFNKYPLKVKKEVVLCFGLDLKSFTIRYIKSKWDQFQKALFLVFTLVAVLTLTMVNSFERFSAEDINTT